MLEVACGPALGLGYLARHARRVVGGDYTESLVRLAAAHYGTRLPVLRFDAHALPFETGTVDVVILFEAIYYLARPGDFLVETRRVLRRDGTLLVCSANPSWSGFAPSPLSVRYYAVPELAALLEKADFAAEIFGCVPVDTASPVGGGLALVRRAAVRLHLMPRTMKGRERLKRIVYGKLSPLPAEIDASPYANAFPLVPLPSLEPATACKVLYAVARVR